MFRLNSNPSVVCCMKCSLVNSWFPVLCLCICLFGAMYTFLTLISYYLNSIFKWGLSFQPLEICKNLVLTAFVLDSQFSAVPNCDRPACQVSQLLIHSEWTWGESTEVETWVNIAAAWRAQPVPAVRCWRARCSQAASSDHSGLTLLFCLQTFSKAKDRALSPGTAQAGHWRVQASKSNPQLLGIGVGG